MFMIIYKSHYHDKKRNISEDSNKNPPSMHPFIAFLILNKYTSDNKNSIQEK